MKPLQQYNDLLKEALLEIKEEELEKLPAEDEIDYEFSKDFIYLGTKKTMESILIDKTTGHSKLGHFHLSTTSQPRIIGKAFFSNPSNKIQFVFDWQENICTHK